MINIQLVAASLPAFIVREGAGPSVRFEAFDFLLSEAGTRRHAAAVMASTCGIPDWSEDGSVHQRHTQDKRTGRQRIITVLTSPPLNL